MKRTPEINSYNLDCMKLMQSKPDKYWNLAIVDPPYGIGVDGKNIIANPSDKNNVKFQKKVHNWDSAPPDKVYFDELFRVSQNQIIWGVIIFLIFLAIVRPLLFEIN